MKNVFAEIYLRVHFFHGGGGGLQGWNESISYTEYINEHELVSTNDDIYVHNLSETFYLSFF